MNIPDVYEARKNICSALGEELSTQYFSLLKQFLSSKITKIQFDSESRKFLQPEQVQLHNMFMLAFLNKMQSVKRAPRSSSSKGNFELADVGDYIVPKRSVSDMPPPGAQAQRFVAQEKFLPDPGLIVGRLLVASWEHGLESGDEAIAELVCLAVQVIMKDIVTAMVSKCSSYKVREGQKFQHGFGQPVPNPWLRNSDYVEDESEESKVEITEPGGIAAANRPTLERAEQKVAFALSCSKNTSYAPKKLTMKLLYRTLLENPSCISNQPLRMFAMEKILTQIDGSP